MKLKDLLTFYAAAMHEGDAALFIGSGMSRPAGFVDWTGLLAKCASEIGLNAEREEHDLVAVAQYYLNRRGRDRSALNQALIDEFYKPGARTENHTVLAGLPVSTIWTTNFDVLIEEALRTAHKRVDVKLRDHDIARRKKGREVVLYKMHGDIAQPDEVIICKDDYERYAKTHPIFQNTLEGDLLTKTFLFLGFSFKDPNLEHMLGHLRSLLNESKRTHYAVMRRVRLKWDKDKTKAEEKFEYETVKQSLQIENLQRYSIYTYLVDRYKDIKNVLVAIKREYSQRIVYLWVQETDKAPEKLADLGRRLGERLLNDEYKICCDFDTRVGRAIFSGAKSKCDEKHLYPLDRYLTSPMPTSIVADPSPSEFASASRQEMIRRSGFVIYLGGNIETDQAQIFEDFEFAAALEAIPIPVGGSGSAARNIWERVQTNLGRFYGGAVSLETLAGLNDDNLDTVVDAIFDIIHHSSSRESEQRPRFQISQSQRRELYYHLREEFPLLPDRTIRRIAGDL